MKINTPAYWENRYVDNQTGWDLGEISPPLKSYFDQLNNRSLKILIPGAGNAYEAEYLFAKGFKNVFVLDIAKQPLLNLKDRLPNFPESQLINKDFFEFTDQFDLIIEQTFFCALPPELRQQYVLKMHNLLKLGGSLAGLLFDFPLTEKGPPFGGSEEEYIKHFDDLFTLKVLEKSYNSHESRIGKEFFFKVIKTYEV
jgi:thiopurine S-methyltransferase